jgi:integrase
MDGLPAWRGGRHAVVGAGRRGSGTVPGTRTKNHRELVLPLARQTVTAIEAWPRIVKRDLLFGRTSDRGFNGWSDAKLQLDKRLGFNRAWDVHDLRRTAQTRMIGLGIPRDHVNRVLNHAMGPIDEAYDRHDYLDEKRRALQVWADALERL